jgi:Fic family protein
MEKISFTADYQITPLMAKKLMRIEAYCQKAKVISSDQKKILRKKAKEELAAYFRIIEDVPDGLEQKSYQMALRKLAVMKEVSEKNIKIIHGYLLGKGSSRDRATPYRTGQNGILDGQTNKVLYLPPRAVDVAPLMKSLVKWINDAHDVPGPIIAAVAHYGINAIHPYYDGNGRTARLLTRLILRLSGYDMGGLYCLEKHYTRDLEAYYNALGACNGKDYYKARAKGDITGWIDYFLTGIVAAYSDTMRKKKD